MRKCDEIRRERKELFEEAEFIEKLLANMAAVKRPETAYFVDEAVGFLFSIHRRLKDESNELKAEPVVCVCGMQREQLELDWTWN